MKLYQFRQNNTGGSFTGPAISVYIEADNAEDANNIALDNDIYFDGVDEDMDCECCGDRWYRVSERDAYDAIDENPWSSKWATKEIPQYIVIKKGK